MESEHLRHRAELVRLADSSFSELVAAEATRRGIEAKDPWRREWAEFDPGVEPFASMLYAAASGPQVRVTVHRIDPGDAVPDAAGWVRIVPVGEDNALDGLATLLERHPAAIIVRYRPGKRCVLRVGDGAAVRYAKLVDPATGAMLHDVAVALTAARLEGRVAFRVAEPDHFDAEIGALWQHAVAGTDVIDALRTTTAPTISRRIGRALGELTVSGVPAVRHISVEDQLARSARAAAHVRRRVPALTATIDRVMAELAERHRATGPAARWPVHGSPHARQWLDDGETLGLVDFDRFATGDPELDLATYLGELDFERQLAQPVPELAAALYDGFESTGPRLDRNLLGAYRAHKRLAKVARTAKAIRPDGDDRAMRHLRRVVASLDDADALG